MWRKPVEAKPSPLPSRSSAAEEVAASSLPFSPPTRPAQPVAPSVATSNSAISSGIRIHGEISGSSDLYIDGEAHGQIRLEAARVTIGPNGRVQADIEGGEIVVQGRVKGNLTAEKRIFLCAAGRVQGSLMAPNVAIEEGASLRGKVETIRAAESATGSATAVRSGSESNNLRPVGVRADGD
jgi:cytoskeletal protein CcmA (bactofilin family)